MVRVMFFMVTWRDCGFGWGAAKFCVRFLSIDKCAPIGCNSKQMPVRSFNARR